MNEMNGGLHSTQESFFFSLNKSNSILSQNSIPFDYTIQRGPKYRVYAELRESKLRFKQSLQQEEIPQPLSTITPPKKRVTFQNAGGDVVDQNRNRNRNRNRNVASSSSSSSVVARSVPDFSAVLRKENRKPASNTFDLTPPSSKSSPSSRLAKLGGSRSAGGAEKRGGVCGLRGRKSCASIEELKGISSGVASAINGAGRTGRVIQKTVLGSTHFY